MALTQLGRTREPNARPSIRILRQDRTSSETHPAPSARDGRNRLVRIRKQVEGYVREARQSVYELRSSSPPTCPALATALTEFGAQTAGGTIAFESHVEGEPLEYSAKLRMAVIRIGQEAIMNAVRH